MSEQEVLKLDEMLENMRMMKRRNEEEKDKAIRMHLKNYFYDWYKENTDDLVKVTGLKEIGDYTKRKYKQNKERIYMITVNVMEEVEIGDLITKIEKCCRKIWVEKWMWCLEWRDMDEGLHAHIRLELCKRKKPSEVKRECYNTFKNLVGNVRHVDCKFGIREDSFVNYIKGIKDGKEKANGEHDRENRLVLGLENWYEGLNR